MPSVQEIRKALYNALIPSSLTPSPKFGHVFRIQLSFMEDMAIMFHSKTKFGYDGVFKLSEPLVTTPGRFEAWLIRTVMRTKFKNYLVKDERYIVDFTEIQIGLIEALFNIVLLEGNNITWLLPLQELILHNYPAGLKAQAIKDSVERGYQRLWAPRIGAERREARVQFDPAPAYGARFFNAEEELAYEEPEGAEAVIARPREMALNNAPAPNNAII